MNRLTLASIACFILIIISFVNGESCDGKTFSYDPNAVDGPSRWGQICDGWEICGNGKLQSPIDLKNETRLPEAASNDFSGLSTNYRTITTTTYNSDSKKVVGVRVNSEDNFQFFGGPKREEGVEFKLTDIQIRTPSEHTIDGKRFSSEIQLIHTSGDRTAILSILVNALGIQPDPFLQTLIDNIVPKVGGDSKEYSLNFADVFPPSYNYYYYKGSLTSPPCTENVDWFVLDQTILANLAQMNHFSFYFAHGNSRPAQVKNEDRVVYNYQNNTPPLSYLVVAVLSVLAFFVLVFVIVMAIVNKIRFKHESVDVFDVAEQKSLIHQDDDDDDVDVKKVVDGGNDDNADDGYQAGAYQTDV